MAWFKKSRSDTAAAKNVAPQAQTRSELNVAEQAWIADNLARLAAEGMGSGDIAALGDFYDSNLARWRSLPVEDRDDPNELVNCIGIGFGEYVRQRSGTRWLLVTDEHGTELALEGQPGDILMFPVNMVAKRWSSGEVAALPTLADATVAAIEEFRSRASRG